MVSKQNSLPGELFFSTAVTTAITNPGHSSCHWLSRVMRRCVACLCFTFCPRVMPGLFRAALMALGVSPGESAPFPAALRPLPLGWKHAESHPSCRWRACPGVRLKHCVSQAVLTVGSLASWGDLCQLWEVGGEARWRACGGCWEMGEQQQLRSPPCFLLTSLWLSVPVKNGLWIQCTGGGGVKIPTLETLEVWLLWWLHLFCCFVLRICCCPGQTLARSWAQF